MSSLPGSLDGDEVGDTEVSYQPQGMFADTVRIDVIRAKDDPDGASSEVFDEDSCSFSEMSISQTPAVKCAGKTGTE